MNSERVVEKVAQSYHFFGQTNHSFEVRLVVVVAVAAAGIAVAVAGIAVAASGTVVVIVVVVDIVVAAAAAAVFHRPYPSFVQPPHGSASLRHNTASLISGT